MNNSVFRKTTENLRKPIKVDLIRGWKLDRMCCLVTDHYLSHKVFDGKLIPIHNTKNKTQTKQANICWSMCFSKYLIYDFCYNNIIARYGDKAGLLYTHNDSLLFQVETYDTYKDMQAN